MNRSSDSTGALHAPTTDVVPEALPGCQAPESSPRTAAAPNALKRCVKRCEEMRRWSDGHGKYQKAVHWLKCWKWQCQWQRNWGSLGTSLVSLTWSRPAGTRSKQIQRNPQDATTKVLSKCIRSCTMHGSPLWICYELCAHHKQANKQSN